MKSKPIIMILQGALALSLVLSVVFCLQSIFLSRDLRTLNYQMASIQGYRNRVQAIVNDCALYSQQNPAIRPYLEAVGVKFAPTNNGKPAGK